MSTARRSPLRSIITRVSVFLLLGAIVNVAVALGCIAWATPHSHHYPSACDVPWPQSVPQDWPRSCNIWPATALGVLVESTSAVDEAGNLYESDRSQFGLPAKCVQRDWCIQLSHSLATKFSEQRPLHPIWPGFALNTLFYAAILWGLFAAPFALRRRRRIKRGLCPKCAYPVGSSDVCTECGAALPKQKAQMQKAETS